MKNKVYILAEGYSRADSTDTDCMRANCTCCLVQTQSGRNIIVDTMTAWDGEVIVKALEKLGLRCQDIHFVVCTHGHSDHIGCNYLFQNAEWHFVGTCKSHADKYPECNFDEPFPLDKDNVIIVKTPGHTLTCVSVVVHNADTIHYGSGTVGICGDLFEREEDVWQPDIWLGAGSENAKLQRTNRYKIAEMCSIIIPGHGKGFQVTNDIRRKLEKDLKLNDE